MSNSDKIILDLCGGTGSWSKPYKEAGYNVFNITLPSYDVRHFTPPDNVYGILAAPPCTEFAISGIRWWGTKQPELLAEALEVVRACLRIVEESSPTWWALENPVGRLPRYIGKYRYTFQPYEYGDPWAKRTCIWGKHNRPVKTPVAPIGLWTGGTPSGKLGIVDHLKYLPPDWIHKMPPSKDRTILRSITPPSFAKAFYEVNR